MLDPDGWGLEGEGLGLQEGLVFLSELGGVGIVFPMLCCIGGVVVEVGGERWRHWSLVEPGGVWSGLGAELGEIEIGAGAVTEVH